MKFEIFYPLKPWAVSQGFGENKADFYKKLGMLGHNGIDVPCPDGTLIRAAHDGVVTFTGEDGSGGLGVVIRTTQKYEYKDYTCLFKSIYWHLKPSTIVVKAGDMVKVGQVLAQADNTGLSTGTHLHFGLKPVLQGEQDWEWFNLEQDNGYKGAINPNPYFTFYYAEDQTKVISILQSVITLLRKCLLLK